MTTLRFRQRHVHRTIAAYIESALAELGWVVPPVNFGTVPVTFIEIQPDENGEKVAPNTVAITLGDEPADEDLEMGNGLQGLDLPVFVDIYGVEQSVAVSIASDVKSVLKNAVIPLYDYTGAPPVVTDDLIEFEDVTGPEKPAVAREASDFRKYWRVVKAIAHVEFVEQ